MPLVPGMKNCRYKRTNKQKYGQTYKWTDRQGKVHIPNGGGEMGDGGGLRTVNPKQSIKQPIVPIESIFAQCIQFSQRDIPH